MYEIGLREEEEGLPRWICLVDFLLYCGCEKFPLGGCFLVMCFYFYFYFGSRETFKLSLYSTGRRPGEEGKCMDL